MAGDIDARANWFISTLTMRYGSTGSGAAYKPLGYLVLAALGSLAKEDMGLLAEHARAGARELFKMIEGRPTFWELEGGVVEYILGYVPDELSLVPQRDIDRIQQWHECLGEAFLLVGIHPVDWKAQDYEKFLARVQTLVMKIAKLAVACDDSWQALRESEGKGSVRPPGPGLRVEPPQEEQH